jgi:predicted metalloprotease with PDZ domain
VAIILARVRPTVTASLKACTTAIVVVLVAQAFRPAHAQPLAPVTYTVRFVARSAHVADVEAAFPTDGLASIDLMMAIWSPGFYKVEDYATRVQGVSAHTPDGSALTVEHPRKNRWRIDPHGASTVVLSYRVTCDERSVTTNFVGDDYAVLNGAPTFITLADRTPRPHEVRLELPAGWAGAMTALEPGSDRAPNHYRAADYDTLVDSPIVAGNPVVQDFEVNGSRHHVVEVGDVRDFDGARAARDLKAIVEAHARLWGGLPFTTYDFLLVFRPGGGGLEHSNSVLATTQAAATQTEAGYLRWLNFISHEYCHAFNVKRLRPVELGPFDYEREPRTPSLWISEGFTSYFGNLAVLRAGLADERAFLTSTSSQIAQLQSSPGRLVQTLAESSLDVWTSEGISGVNTNANTSVSYYLKGQIAGFLLDAKVRRATNGARSLDDVMRLAYRRYGGERGFRPDEFRATAEEVAGVDLAGWFMRTVSSTEELDYTDALDWYGLRFAAGGWTLEAAPDATAAQRDRLRALFQRY